VARRLLGLLLGSLPMGGAFAAVDTFVPAEDSTVVETLRTRPLERADVEFRVLRATLRTRRGDAATASAVAQRAMGLARRDGDPRYLGYAQAALAPWWDASEAPESVRIAKGTLLQSVHRFDAALEELDRVVAENPAAAQAWLTRASILQVQGRYRQAAESCERLAPLGLGTIGRACLAELRSLSIQVAPSGPAEDPEQRAAAARVELEQLAALAARDGGVVGSWLELMLAELAERAGDAVEAERAFRLALASNPDAYTRGAFADFLLDRGRASEVLVLLQGQERNDALLLRLAIAQAALGLGDAASRSEAALAARFAAARLRGDRLHQREEARFELQLRRRPDAAVALALENWAVQKEPADARLLLEAARVAGRPELADPARRDIRENRPWDRRLAALLQ